MGAGRTSAGLLVYRFLEGELQVLLVHPGGPFWIRKDPGVWSIPKGSIEAGEDPLTAALREFGEETGCRVEGPYIPLSTVRQSKNKTVMAWAVEGDCDISAVRSNTFEMEWPPGSGLMRMFPEVDRAGWFAMAAAHEKILKGQIPFLDELERILNQTPEAER